MSVTLSTLVSLAARDGAMLRHDLQDNTKRPPTTRNYLCGQLSCPNVSKIVCCTVTLTKLRARLSQPLAQRADLAAAHPPPEITYADSKLSECVYVSVTLTKLLARLSHPTEQRADRAAAHPPPEITYADSKLSELACPLIRQ